MDDLISRQAAYNTLTEYYHHRTETQHEALREALGRVPDAEPDTGLYVDGFDDGFKEGEQRWIPVTERLPERGKDVLVTRDYDGRMDCIKSCRYVEVACRYGEDDNAVWSAFSDEYKMTPSMHKVVAWMPLPEPYKGGEQDGRFNQQTGGD